MLRPGKIIEIGNEILKFKLDIVALQEIRWEGEGIVDKREFSILNSGSRTRTGLYGMGFIVAKRIKASILEFEAFNEKICRLRL